MAFDECIPYPSDKSYVADSVARTTRWLHRCADKLTELNKQEDAVNCNQMLFGINQGGVFEDLRIEHAKEITQLDLPGYAIGGLAVGESHEQMYSILDAVVPYLPEDKPVYLMGVGTPENILEAVDSGVDFFDCVLPARNGRHGSVYTSAGKLHILNAKYEQDDCPLDDKCGCPACVNYSRAYIRHLFKAKEMLALRLCVMHNLFFYNSMMEEIRIAIEGGYFQKYKKEKLYCWQNVNKATIVGGQVAETVTETAGTAASAASGTVADPSVGAMNPIMLILFYGLLLVALYFFMFRPQRKRDKQMKEMQESIRSGDNVVTSSGFYGKVVDIGEDCFVVEFGTNRGIRVPVRKADVVGIKTPNVNPSLTSGGTSS
ncbi:queuine trna-ribosyltransferase [Holotrichia oblita]|nr:queuine trna-ribosyltransferase [Holotrichia oblita]